MARRVTRKGPPSLAYILARADEVEERDKKRNDRWDEYETARHCQRPVKIPEQFKSTLDQEVQVTFIDETLRTVSSNVAASFPVARQAPRGTGQDAQKRSTKLEKWLQSAFARLNDEGGPHHPYQDTLDYAGMFGCAVFKSLYLPDSWEFSDLDKQANETEADYNQRVDAYTEQAPIPLNLSSLDPRTYHGYREGNRLVEVLEINERPRFEVAAQYSDVVHYDPQESMLRPGRLGEPLADSALGAGSGYRQKVKFIEHWIMIEERSKDGKRTVHTWVSYVADGVLLDQFDTKYPRLPYFPYFGLSTASRIPEYEAISVVGNMLGYVNAINVLYTAWLHWAWRTAMPMGTYESMPGSPQLTDGKNPLDYVEWEPGVFKALPAGGKLGWVTAPEVGADIQKLGDILIRLADRASNVPGILKGELEKDIPAWGMAQLLMAARRIYDPITSNASAALSQLMEFWLRIIETRHKLPVSVIHEEGDEGERHQGFIKLAPSDIGGYYAVSVEINALTQDRRIQEGQFGLSLYQAGVISLRELLENYLHYSAPEEMMEEVMAEKFRQSDPYMQWIMDRVWSRLRPQEAAAAGATPEELAMLGQIPPPQMPGQLPPGMPPEGMAGPPPGPESMPGGVQPIAGVPSPQAPEPGLGLPLVPPNPPGLMV